MDNITRTAQLLRKFINKDITQREYHELMELVRRYPELKDIMNDMSEPAVIKTTVRHYRDVTEQNGLSMEKIWSEIATDKEKHLVTTGGSQRNLLPWVAAFFLIGFSALFLLRELIWTPSNVSDEKQFVQIVKPGSSKAKLLVGAHDTVSFDAKVSGVNVNNQKLTYKTASGTIEMNLAEQTMNVLKVPKGGEFRLTLDDGTVVWLNASSELRFPTKFSSNTREVQLIGEAYFEVKHDKARPFIVRSKQQELKVLGTAFNVKAYEEDYTTSTALVHGKVEIESNKVGDYTLLEPGYCAFVDELFHIRKEKLDLDEAISWKQGEFHFRRTPVTEVLKQIARWYDVDVKYNRSVPKEYFTGQLSRNVEFDVILQFLKDSGIQVVLEDKKLVVL